MAGVGCKTGGATGGGATPAANPVASALAALAGEYWEQRMLADPVEATLIGDRRFDDRLPDESPAALDAEVSRLRALRSRVASLNIAGLSAADRTTQALLLGQLDDDLARDQCNLDEWSVDPREGPQVEYLRLAELQPVSTVAQGTALVARWRAMGPAVDQKIANLRRALGTGKVAARDDVVRTLKQLDDLLAQPDASWVLRAPAAQAHGDWPAPAGTAFVVGIDDAIASRIRPAFARYRAVIHDEILPHARDQAHVGLLNIADGPACYRRLIKVHTSLDLTPEEIHQFGLAEVARIRAETERLGGTVLGTTDFATIQRRLRDDPALHFSTRAEIEETARAALGRAAAAEPKFLSRRPRTPCVVKRIEGYEERDSTIAYYQPAATYGTRPGTYYVNTFEPATRPRFEAEVLAFHESIPGHHIQIALAQELPDVPTFRQHLGVTAFVEGWGLYAERLSDELGLYSSPLARLGMLSFDAWRASRLVVDTGMHAFGWSRERAIQYLRDNTLLADNNIVNEIDRYIGWPAQAVAYKIGQREILRLRDEARTRLRTRFDLRAFHDVVLGSGAVSLTVLRAQVTTWAAAVAAGRP
jgi:uncharacterized protein (DUF885 family)